MSNKSLENKVIIVTGGSGGIGSAIVNQLLDCKANIVSVFCNNYPSEQSSENILCFKADLEKSEDWDRLILFVLKKYGKIDILINCAGYLEPGDFLSIEENKIKKMIETNFISVIIGIHKILEIFQKQGSGHIINIGSLGGIVPMPYTSIYCATKFALRGFSLSLAQELKGTGIKISLLTTDSVVTKMLDRESENSIPTISFYNNPLPPQLIAKEVVQIIDKPKVEKTITRYRKLPSIVLGAFSNLYQFIYPIIEKRSEKKREEYLKRKMREIN